MRLTDFRAPVFSNEEGSDGKSSSVSKNGHLFGQGPPVSELRPPPRKRFKPDPATQSGKPAQRLILPDHFDNAPLGVQRLIREIRYCRNRGFYDLAAIACRDLLEMAILEFLKKSVFPSLDTSQLLRKSFQFWVDSLCRWAPPILLSNEVCNVIRDQAAKVGQATIRTLEASDRRHSVENSEDLIFNTLHAVNLLFPADADHY